MLARAIRKENTLRGLKVIPPPGLKLSPSKVKRFRGVVYRHYETHGRAMPWRETRNPYRILVSEIMLQQTQVERVAGKYGEFLARFPDFKSLARAPLPEILAAWQGLGYNRRALALKRLARRVVAEWAGRLPATDKDLRTLPGIGPATARAILAFAFERPVAFIETNIRRVFLHCFFAGREGVTDREILPLVEATLDRERVRTWYYALMDYGAGLKGQGLNPNRRSAHYARQSPFAGSDRQIRGHILRILLDQPDISVEELVAALNGSPVRVLVILQQLQEEGFLLQEGNQLHIATGP